MTHQLMSVLRRSMASLLYPGAGRLRSLETSSLSHAVPPPLFPVRWFAVGGRTRQIQTLLAVTATRQAARLLLY